MDDIAGILEFYRDAGVDVPLDDQPVNRLALPEPRIEQSSQRSQAFPEMARAQPARPRIDSFPALTAEATEIARQAETMEALQEALTKWDGIELARAIPTMLFGSGPEQSDLLVIVDCPEQADGSSGQLWSGPAGQMAERMLAAIGRSRSDTRFAAACPWRPPGGVPNEEQQALMRPFLLRHIALARPRAIVSFGQAAMRTVCPDEGQLLGQRGRWQKVELAERTDSPEPLELMPTFHPLYLLRNPAQKRLVWADLLALKSRLAPGV